MNWLEHAKKLQAGETISFRPKGNSMLPKIKSGQLCTVAPFAEGEEPKKNDIVFCKVNGNWYVHLVTAVQGERVQISNNHGHVNGWTSRSQVYGKCIKVED
jgi:phage repressor protein C with HTH and peptisase S24 domain